MGQKDAHVAVLVRVLLYRSYSALSRVESRVRRYQNQKMSEVRHDPLPWLLVYCTVLYVGCMQAGGAFGH